MQLMLKKDLIHQIMLLKDYLITIEKNKKK